MAVLLEPTYEKEDDIPEAHRELFTEKAGKWELTGVRGLKTEADVARLQKSLHGAQEDNKKLKASARVFEAFGTPEDLQAKLDKFDELELLAKGKLDDAKVDELVQKRVEASLKTKTGPLERQVRQLTDENATLKTTTEAMVTKEKRRTIHDDIRAAAMHKDIDLRPEAIEDALLHGIGVFEIVEDGRVLTRDGVGATPGIDAKAWLQDQRSKRRHWWPESVSGGARGSRGGVGGTGPENPWSHDGWNMTKQGQFFREHGAEKAAKAAEAAGTRVGGPRPKAPAK